MAQSGMPLPFTSLNAATASSTGTSKDLEALFANHFMITKVTGTPTSYSVTLEGSHDGTLWVALGSVNGDMVNETKYLAVTDKPVRYVRAVGNLYQGTSPTL